MEETQIAILSYYPSTFLGKDGMNWKIYVRIPNFGDWYKLRTIKDTNSKRNLISNLKKCFVRIKEIDDPQLKKNIQSRFSGIVEQIFTGIYKNGNELAKDRIP